MTNRKEMVEELAKIIHSWHCPDEACVDEVYWTGPCMQDYLDCANQILAAQTDACRLAIVRKEANCCRWQQVFQEQCEDDGIDYWVVHSVEELQEKLKETNHE